MTLTIRCPNPVCGKSGSVPQQRAGQAVRCSHCRTKFRVPAATGATGEAGNAHTKLHDPAAQTMLQGGAASATVDPAGDPSLASTPTGPAAPPAPPADGPPRQVGRFEVRGVLGSGAFGTVYRAHDPHLDREVALKVARPETLGSSERIERFLHEARTAAKLHHPHIVPVYEAGVDGPHHYIAAAYIVGRTLAQAIAEAAVDCRRAVALVRDLATALAYAHAQGIIHRDVKPANVMLGENDWPYLTDFGLARREDGRTRLTRLGAVLGTPAYMAPEQAAGHSGDSQPASDQYSLGVVLYELLCGRRPFEGPPQVVLFNVMEQEPPAPRSVNPAVPPALEAICLKAMAKRPQERYAGCRQLAEELRHWLEQPVPGPAVPGVVPHPVAAARSTPAVFGAATILVPPSPQLVLPASRPAVPVSVGRGVLVVGGGLIILVGVIVLLLGAILSSPDADQSGPAGPVAGPKVPQPSPGPKQPDALAELLASGRQNLKAKQFEKAVIAFSAVLQVRPEDQATTQLLKQARAGKEEEDAGLKKGQELAARGKKVDQFLEEARARLKTNEFEKARAKIAEAQQLGVQEGEVKAALEELASARASDEKRRRLKAIDEYDEAMGAGAKAAQGRRFPEALQHYERAIKVVAAAGPLLAGEKETAGRLRKAEEAKTDVDRMKKASSPLTNSLGMKLALIPPGSAWLGGGGGKPGTNEVTIAQAFYLGVSPVTQAQWQALMGSNPSWFSRGGGDKDRVQGISDDDLKHFPVEQVSWDDVQEFLKKLNAREKDSGWLYRLPTEVEWEYACRGGPVSKELSAFDFYFDKPTNDLSSDLANFNGNHPAGSGRKGKYLQRTSRVGLYPANALGLHDMHGNVWEWCNDQKGDRVIRGGSWNDYGSDCRAANRYYGFAPPLAFVLHGCRLARVPVGKKDGPEGPNAPEGTVKGPLKTKPLGIGTLGQHPYQVSSVAFSRDGKRIVSGSWDGMVKVWDATTGQHSLTGHSDEVTSVAYIPDGKLTSVAFSPDGKRIISGSAFKTVRVWDAATGRHTRTLTGHQGTVRSVAFSPDGKRIVSAESGAGLVRVWDAATGRHTRTLPAHIGEVTSVAFSPDGKRLASGSSDKTVKVWDFGTGRHTRTLTGHTESVLSVAFSPDGKRIVSGSGDKTLRVWNAATGRETLTLRGHTNQVTSVAFSPDGKRIVSGSWDTTVKLWDATTGRETLTLRGHTNEVSSVAFSPDGKRLVSGSWDKTVRVWDIAE